MSEPPLRDAYVGESLNVAGRFRQHLEAIAKQHLDTARVVVDDRFNKSVCLDLESYLIRMLAGDGAFRVLNRNDGITESDYFDRESYRGTFEQVFAQLKNDGVFTRSIPEIENSDLFKLSPFKALTIDQAVAVESILEGLFEDLERDEKSTIVIQGDPGTGKTVVAIYMLKLLRDISLRTPDEVVESDSMFSDFFTEGYTELLKNLRVGIVVPQQSLRKSIQKVFRKTPGLSPSMVMSPFDVGASSDRFDLLIVDEAHRLNQRANQPSGVQNKKFQDINKALFGFDDTSKSQLDWITNKSAHQIFLIDAAQSVRPADLPSEVTSKLIQNGKLSNRHYRLASQMRVQAGSDYVRYVKSVLAGPSATADTQAEVFEGYEFRLFDDLAAMRQTVRDRDETHGLARMLAGYAWPWISKNDKSSFDLEIDGVQMRWNSTDTDWVASKGSIDEVGSIHTVQGYDLNYAGVIIGPDLRFDATMGRLVFHRDSYADKKGKENNPAMGKVYTDDDLLKFVVNIYSVLLTRGIRGTYVYVCDPPLRTYLKKFVPSN